MREIKFRAWNPEMERFEYDGSVQFDGVIVSGWGADKYDWIIEQFTGLRDKNKKDIYEGDIVRFYYDADLGVMYNSETNKEPYSEMIDIVDFVDGSFVFKTSEGWIAIASRYNLFCEIIGNIHETTELLK